MMRQAVTALGPKTVLAGVLVGSAALALGALFIPRAVAGQAPGMYRLVLHTTEEPGAFYLSAWTEGEVLSGHDASDGKSVTYTRRGDEHDGCSWLGTEKLTPINNHVYAYSYGETILACQPGAEPFRKTPRTGIVTLEKWSGEGHVTALTGVQPAGNLWNGVAENDSDCDCDHGVDDDVAADIEEAQADIAAAQKDLEEAMREAKQAVEEAQAQLDEARHAAASDDE
jgi:hypothetical protein